MMRKSSFCGGGGGGMGVRERKEGYCDIVEGFNEIRWLGVFK